MDSEKPVRGPVAEWYGGRSLLVTGATGFMGKVLLEKLLSSCHDLDKIYALIRIKKEQTPEERLAQIFDTELFDQLRVTRPDAFKKVVACEGDITLPDLGLSEQDQKVLTENVSVVFHSAATVKFDEKLRISVNMNILGTERLIKLCQNMDKLQAFVHVSTAYCNCNRQVIDEIIYESPADLKKLVQCMECLEDDLLNDITPKIIKDRPNTYTFTKAAAEDVLRTHASPTTSSAHPLPIVVVRPSIVTSAWRGPLPGWVDNLNGPTGLFVGAGKGVLRSILCRREMIADFIPVDVAINLVICVAWSVANNRTNQVEIYNCTSGELNPIRWGEIEQLGQALMLKYPLNGVLWYPGGSFKSSRNINTACCMLFHCLPAYVIDFAVFLIGKKPTMVKIYKRLSRAVESLEYFTNREWQFRSTNVPKLWSSLTPEDKRTFYFDITELNWNDYIKQYYMGTKKYILKEKPEDLEKARGHLKRMKYLHYATQIIVGFVIWGLLFHNRCIVGVLCSYIFSVFFFFVGGIFS